jgi:hypothetical protein
MTEITLTEAQKEEIKKEIKIVKASKTGRLYFDKNFNGKDPTEAEMVTANGCGLFAFVKWLKETGEDQTIQSCIQTLTGRGDKSAAALLIEEMAMLKFSIAAEDFRIKEMQSLRKKLDNEHGKKKKGILSRKEKKIREIAMDDPDSIDMEKALKTAKHKADETPPPPYLYYASDALKHGVIWHDSNMKQSSKGRQFLRRFICIAYRTAKTQTKAKDNNIRENIATILNILNVNDGKRFTNENIQSYALKYCTE